MQSKERKDGHTIRCWQKKKVGRKNNWGRLKASSVPEGGFVMFDKSEEQAKGFSWWQRLVKCNRKDVAEKKAKGENNNGMRAQVTVWRRAGWRLRRDGAKNDCCRYTFIKCDKRESRIVLSTNNTVSPVNSWDFCFTLFLYIWTQVISDLTIINSSE